jgi:hypothetical protein
LSISVGSAFAKSPLSPAPGVVDENVDLRFGAQALENRFELGAVYQIGSYDLDRNAMHITQFGSESVESVSRAGD